MPREENTPKTIGERMTTEQLAASAYRAATYASQREPVAWGLLPELDRESWLRMAAQADAILTENEGSTYEAVAAKLIAAFVGGRPKWVMDAAEVISWQAVARHLVQLLDDDEIDDLAALEQSWRGWASKWLQPEKQS
jgi:hypothetical protein